MLITLVVCIAYGIGISKLSFYGDDWIYIYNYHIAGPGSFDLFQRTDRPHSAWVYLLTTALFKENPLFYHLFVLLLRWLSVVLFWKVLADTFGERKTVYTAALLFAVYPGFQQQPIAVEFVMHFFSLALVLLSLNLMQTAGLRPKREAVFLLIISLAAGGLAIFTCEYFIGLELIRPLILFFTLQKNSRAEDKKNILKETAIRLIPFACVTIFYFYWRIFIFSFTSYAPKLLIAMKENPSKGILQLFSKVFSDLYKVLFQAYRLIFSRPGNISLLTAAVILVICGAAVFIFLHRYTGAESGNRENLKMLALGIVLLLFSGIPYWGTFLDVETYFPWDRSTLSFSPGAAIVIAALMQFALKPVFFTAAAAILAAFSALFQVRNTQVYINESEKMNDYFWQLAWRAPALEKGTIIVSENIPLDRTSDNDLSPVVNWQYAPESRSLAYNYKYFDLDLREEFYYSDPNTAIPVEHTYRSHSFSSSTEKTLGLFYKKNGCLQIIDSINNNYPDLPDSLKRVSALSDPKLILTDAAEQAVPPKAIGKEPDHGYCYFFQKTASARQSGDTDAAYQYASEILRADLHPTYAPDLAPVILTLLEKGDFTNAETLLAGSKIGKEDQAYLCDYWTMSLSESPDAEGLSDFYKSHGCL